MTDHPAYLDSFTPETIAAWQESTLRRMPEKAAAMLAETAVEFEVDEGQVVRLERSTSTVVPMLAVSGLVRVYVSSGLGREVTVRYLKQGSLMGIAGAVAGSARHGLQAVTKTRLLILQQATLRHLAQTDPAVSWCLCQELSYTLQDVTDHLSTSVFQSVMERVAATLIRLSEERGGATVVEANQQKIADAVGSVREVVARSLRQLRSSGLIERDGNEFRLLDIPALQRLADYGAADG
jgi:CRP/FNR family transcriptional regulator, cyclic AMP receptor protein